MALVVQESLRGLFYAPYYAALALGAYEKEGVEVSFASAPTPGQAPDGLFHGTVDVAWGGPMRQPDLRPAGSLRPRLLWRGGNPRPVHADRPPADPQLQPGLLTTVRIATVSEVPTPWLCLQEDLRRAGLNPEMLERVADQTMTENVAALRRGDLDVIQVFQPYAEDLIAGREGHLWYAAAARGPCSYTTFYTRHSVLTAKRDEMLRLVRGLYRTQKWLHREPPDALADVIRPYFPNVP